ncbi:hypothetical protein ACLBUO_32395, partial [Pseudomonas aeruginosa]
GSHAGPGFADRQPASLRGQDGNGGCAA